MDELVVVKNQRLFQETDKAILVGPNRQKPNRQPINYWIPLDFISHSKFDGVGSTSDIEIPRWLAIEKDMEF